MMDDGVMELMKARRELDKAHKAACAAMARFQTVKAADIMTADERIAARSLLDQTVPLCKAILCAMQAVPAIAGTRSQTSEVRSQPTSDLRPPTSGLPCTRTAKSLLDEFKAKKQRGVVATSARYGRPIVAAMSVLLISVLCPLSSARADTVERVIDALIQIESSGRPAVIGDGGEAVGCLQIHPVAVREANRIAGSRVARRTGQAAGDRWKLSDRFCPAKSRAMARTILVWHVRRGCTDPVELACKWNRPFGQVSAQYRAKVEAALGTI